MCKRVDLLTLRFLRQIAQKTDGSAERSEWGPWGYIGQAPDGGVNPTTKDAPTFRVTETKDGAYTY